LSTPETLVELLEDLTGQAPPLSPSFAPSFPAEGLGLSQLNELLLLLGYDRVTHSFFQFLVDGSLDYQAGCGLPTLDELKDGVERARKLSLLFFGNVKFGFKKLARDADELAFYLGSTQPVEDHIFEQRHEPIYPVDPISSDETFYLGYIVQRELDAKLEKNPRDAAALEQRAILERVREKGTRNQEAYLVSDHLDVYVATSMRRRHEYVEVSEFTHKLFSDERIHRLKLRWFDPTQAYCRDRIDKGLAEALMLKRAKCTLYLAQESDTLGKDSELASTLAQGKPVIAYVPSLTEQDVRESVERLSLLYGQPVPTIIIERLQTLNPNLAWADSQVRRWLDNPSSVDGEAAMALLVKTTREHYDKRAETLRESHPLGIQVNLDTGVANGVLVVRSVADCAELILRIVTKRLEFYIEKKSVENLQYFYLVETVSKSIFRVMTGDAMLTNSFWNFYLEPSE